MQAAENPSALQRVSLPRWLLILEEMKPRSVLNCQILLSICFVAFPRGRLLSLLNLALPPHPLASRDRREPAPAAGTVFPLDGARRG